MVRVKEVLILEDTSFLDEKLSTGAIEITFRRLIYVLVGGLMSYKLIESYKVADILLGVLILALAFALAFYPARSIRLESIIIGAFSYSLSSLFAPDPEKAKRPPKAKRTDKRKAPSLNVLNVVRRVASTENVMLIFSSVSALLLYKLMAEEFSSPGPQLIVTMVAFAVSIALLIVSALMHVGRMLKRG